MGKKRKINEGQKLELVDRLHSMIEIFDAVVVGHPAAPLLEKELAKTQNHLAALYVNSAGKLITYEDESAE